MPATVKSVSQRKGLRCEIYFDGGKRYRYRVVTANGVVQAIAPRGFKSHERCVNAARREHPNLPLIDFTYGDHARTQDLAAS